MHHWGSAEDLLVWIVVQGCRSDAGLLRSVGPRGKHTDRYLLVGLRRTAQAVEVAAGHVEDVRTCVAFKTGGMGSITAESKAPGCRRLSPTLGPAAGMLGYFPMHSASIWNIRVAVGSPSVANTAVFPKGGVAVAAFEGLYLLGFSPIGNCTRFVLTTGSSPRLRR